jgi:hypothetical protein
MNRSSLETCSGVQYISNVAATAQQIAEVLAGMRAESARLVAASAQPAAQRLSTGLWALDALLEGGLPRGRLTELSGPRSSGRMSATLAMTAAAQATGELVALVDVADALDPRSAARAGVLLLRLLWVRPRSVVDGLKAADWLLDVGGFGLVVLYLAGVAAQVVDAEAHVGWNRRQSPKSMIRGDAPWLKLARRAERAKAAMVIVADRPLVGTLGALSLAAERGRGKWLGHNEAPRLLDGINGRIAVARNKLGPSLGSAALPLCIDLGALAEALLPVPVRPARRALELPPVVDVDAIDAIVVPAQPARELYTRQLGSPLPAGARLAEEPAVAVPPKLARNFGSGGAPNPGSPSFENRGFAAPPVRSGAK